MIREETIKKWNGKKVSVFGYKYNPQFPKDKNQEVLHFVGTIQQAKRFLDFPMWCKEYEETDKNKSLLGNTGILVDIPK